MLTEFNGNCILVGRMVRSVEVMRRASRSFASTSHEETGQRRNAGILRCAQNDKSVCWQNGSISCGGVEGAGGRSASSGQALRLRLALVPQTSVRRTAKKQKSTSFGNNKARDAGNRDCYPRRRPHQT